MTLKVKVTSRRSVVLDSWQDTEHLKEEVGSHDCCDSILIIVRVDLKSFNNIINLNNNAAAMCILTSTTSAPIKLSPLHP